MFMSHMESHVYVVCHCIWRICSMSFHMTWMMLKNITLHHLSMECHITAFNHVHFIFHVICTFHIAYCMHIFTLDPTYMFHISSYYVRVSLRVHISLYYIRVSLHMWIATYVFHIFSFGFHTTYDIYIPYDILHMQSWTRGALSGDRRLGVTRGLAASRARRRAAAGAGGRRWVLDLGLFWHPNRFLLVST